MRKLCILVAILLLARGARAETVWIDTDVSIGSPIREVDDAYAVALAFQSPEIGIAGLSTTYGNAPIGQTTHAAQELTRRFGRWKSLATNNVFMGARSKSDLGRPSRASEALAVVLRKRPVTYVALGPLTNLATFLRLHPRLAHRLDRIIFVGGTEPGARLAFGPNQSFQIHDANVFKDPAAAAAVLRSGIPLTLVPIATSSKLQLEKADLGRLEGSGPLGSYLGRQSRIWFWFWTHLVGTRGGPIFDALAIIPATRPEFISLETRYARMDQAGNLLVTPNRRSGSRRIRYCTVFAPGTKRFIMQRLETAGAAYRLAGAGLTGRRSKCSSAPPIPGEIPFRAAESSRSPWR